MPAEPKSIHVYRVPHPMFDLPTIGPDGADLPADEAKALIARGLATTDKPGADPKTAAPAAPEE